MHEVSLGGVTGPINYPAAHTANTATADVENLDGGFKFIDDLGEHVRVSAIVKYDCVLLQYLVDCGQTVAKFGRSFKVELSCGLLHLGAKIANIWADFAGHELG